jgi:hypothetical protein
MGAHSGSRPTGNNIFVPPYVIDSLSVHYDANDIISYPGTGTTWFDISNNNRNGTLTNGPTFVSSDPKHISFDGSNDTVNFTFDLRTSWSYECWVNHNAVSGFGFLGQGGSSSNAGLHIWFQNSSSIRFGMFSNDSDATSLTTSTGIWYQYVFTYNHSSPFTKQIYRNAVALTMTNQQTQGQYAGTGTVRIGGIYSSGSSGYANGRFAIVRLYNKVLSLSEVQQNFTAFRGRFGI